MSRRTSLHLAAACAAALIAPAAAGRQVHAETPLNVLFIAVDDLRPQLGCYGRKQMISPSIDRLAAEGIRFDHAYCQVPVCGASRSSLLTGARPTPARYLGYATWADRDYPGVPSLPKTFKKNGYITISNGKVYHHKTDGKGSWSEPAWRPAIGGLTYRDPEHVALAKKLRKENPGNQRLRGPPFDAGDVDDNAYPDGLIAEKTMADLERLARAGKPFFLAAGFLKPHLPFNCPKKYWDMYSPEAVRLAPNPWAPRGAPKAALHTWGELRSYHGIPKKGPVSKEMARTLVHGYYACVTYTDTQIGKVLAKLDELGLKERTVVILWGDHGWQLGEHGLWCKHCNFKTSLNAPLIVRHPTLGRRKASSALVEFVDIYPTLCELAGLSLPAHLEGTSFVPLLKNPDRPWKEAVFCRYFNGDSIKTKRYLYTEWRRKGKGPVYARMLYDHQTDSAENINISEDPKNAKLVEKLSRMLRDGWKKAPGLPQTR